MCAPVGLYLLVFSYDFIKAGKGDKSLKSALACSYGIGASICSQIHYTLDNIQDFFSKLLIKWEVN